MKTQIINQSELSEINSLINQLLFTNHLDANELITIDQNLAVQEEMTEREIVNIVKGQSEDDEKDNNTINKPEPTITSTDAIKGLEMALKYVQQKNLEVIRNVNKSKKEISYKNSQEKVQKKIEEYYIQ